MSESKVNCARCRKEVAESDKVVESIIYRGREMKYDSWKKKYVSKAVVKTKNMNFCSTTCAMNEQMAHEG